MEPLERDGDEEEASGGGKGRGGRYGRGGMTGWTGGGAEEDGEEGVASVTGGGEDGASPGTAASVSNPSPYGFSFCAGVFPPVSPSVASADGGLLLSPSSIELRLITPGAGAITPSAMQPVRHLIVTSHVTRNLHTSSDII